MSLSLFIEHKQYLWFSARGEFVLWKVFMGSYAHFSKVASHFSHKVDSSIDLLKRRNRPLRENQTLDTKKKEMMLSLQTTNISRFILIFSIITKLYLHRHIHGQKADSLCFLRLFSLITNYSPILPIRWRLSAINIPWTFFVYPSIIHSTICWKRKNGRSIH